MLESYAEEAAHAKKHRVSTRALLVAAGKLDKHAETLKLLEQRLAQDRPLTSADVGTPLDPANFKPVGGNQALQQPDAGMRSFPPIQATLPYPQGDPSDPEIALKQLEWAKEQLIGNYERTVKDTKRGSGAGIAAVAMAFTRMIEVQAKIRTEMKPRRSQEPEGFAELSEKILIALEQFPEAKNAVLAAITDNNDRGV